MYLCVQTRLPCFAECPVIPVPFLHLLQALAGQTEYSTLLCFKPPHPLNSFSWFREKQLQNFWRISQASQSEPKWPHSSPRYCSQISAIIFFPSKQGRSGEVTKPWNGNKYFSDAKPSEHAGHTGDAVDPSKQSCFWHQCKQAYTRRSSPENPVQH